MDEAGRIITHNRGTISVSNRPEKKEPSCLGMDSQNNSFIRISGQLHNDLSGRFDRLISRYCGVVLQVFAESVACFLMLNQDAHQDPGTGKILVFRQEYPGLWLYIIHQCSVLQL